MLCPKIKRRRLAKNKVTGNPRHLNGEKNVKKKKTKILNDGRPESFKNKICQKRKQRKTGNLEKGNTQQFNPENLKKKKTEILLDDRVKRYKKQIWEGPYYICTIRHRSFYWCSVRYFSIENYNNFKMIYIPATTFDSRLHICLTCHKSVSKEKIPCQAVCNKLQVEAAPKGLQDLRRLEKVLISRRILFKKQQ